MNNDEVKRSFIEAVRARGIYSKWNPSNSELITKCPFCGDNNRPDDGHLYIGANYGIDGPMVYHCFRCNAGGVVNAEVAEELISDDDIINSIKQFTKNNRFNIKTGTGGKTYNWLLPKADTEYKYKLDYISYRLGCIVDVELFIRCKVILDFKKFFELNKINVGLKPNMIENLQQNFVGFLSSKGTHIWMRNLKENDNIRWMKYPLVHDNNTRNFYSISSRVDVLTEDIIDINLSEGIFDCISIWKNLDHDNDVNIAVGSSDYCGTIDYLISTGFMGDNVHLNIYSDNDDNNTTSLWYHKKTLEKYKHIFGLITIYYNIKSKDCGVPKSQIKLKKEVLRF